jgi:hypothetical protein
MRYSDETNGGKVKPRPDGFSKRKCFANFLEVFGTDHVHVVADCLKPDTEGWLGSKGVTVHVTKFGNGGDSFIHAIDLALRTATNDAESAYLVEDDNCSCRTRERFSKRASSSATTRRSTTTPTSTWTAPARTG